MKEKLIPAIGLKDIVALTINGIIGAGIFALPATAAKLMGNASPLAFLCAGIFTTIIVVCFAELSGKFVNTGGAYIYAFESFGGLVAFLIGWMYFLARLTSIAALSNAMVGFCKYFMPVDPMVRVVLIASVLILLGTINFIGIRFSSWLINYFTIGKMIPLLLFIIVGIWLLPRNPLAGMQLPDVLTFKRTVLVVMFAFTGFEVIAIPAAEVIHPRRTLPLGILIGTGITIVVYLLIQLVAVGFHPNLGVSEAPLAEAATQFLGTAGGTFLTAGAVISTMGTLASLLLVAPRILYAMALQRQMPGFFSGVHPRFRTPHVSILCCTITAILLSESGSFTKLVTLSAMARLMTYIGSAAALIVLRKKKPSPDTFQAPAGYLFPVLTILVSLLLLTAAKREDWISGSIALGIGLLLYFIERRSTKGAPASPPA